ncbi:MAG: 2,3-bisphosphoglycerate-independent phosphoglycerate mutase [Deltaproteobacteria bacterium]|nr:2,3-bisphosphoglycerate-independent phosphoglycerate mutase [Deltaproteobacteria bacterium]MBW1954102.1 2,3-bisphosphoglycerate-independent phosphoglycerate mutase [Deltaproteobacteria bacterium]MBW2040992.1 2,3-bisphosphoglycerate-independent phosphoglycerate mutase [Deltaproteobacteria bacterium]MBW2131297.1 2,3-bisphosphoglycerate-independent phosphoglycerate mutase [Deltaproteobacteria bacterium]
MIPRATPVLLMILDGWGLNPTAEGNAVAQAQTPFLNALMSAYPVTRLECAGRAVGLPDGIMGNSEVGHLNMGAGRIVYQELLRIDMAIQDGTFFENDVFNALISRVREKGTRLHLMGLVSDGGVHSQLTHLEALLQLSRKKGLEHVYVHAITDGRDTAPDSGVNYLTRLSDAMEEMGCGVVASICGRYFAMDRDTRWDRIEKAYRLYTEGNGIPEKDPVEGIKNAYLRGETDEFIKPVVIVDEKQAPLATVQDGDGIIFFNFRADRAREITRAFTEETFDAFLRIPWPKVCGYVCMTLYDECFHLPVAFPPVHLKNILGEVISHNGLRQLRIAETEKYAHVTYFFNGGEEKAFPLEDRCMIPSPREVPTYDLKPEMSAFEVTREVLARLRSKDYALIVLNFANMDMVGHTGNLSAAIAACQAVDRCVGEIVPEVLSRKGIALITADHGNAELMADDHGHIHTAHTTNPVPFILVDDTRKKVRLKEGILADIAPTLLHLTGIEKPEEMTGNLLLEGTG